MILFTFSLSSDLFSQEWSKAQKEVWQMSENAWAKLKAGDVDGFGSNLHEKYQAWSSDDPLPMTKEQALNMFRARKEKTKFNSISMNPARITVTDNGAVIDYYFNLSMSYLLPDNKSTVNLSGKQVEFWVKEGNKWLLLGDMTYFEQDPAGSRK